MPAARKVTRRPAGKATERAHQRPRFDFRQTLVQFLTNKAVAEAATARNEGDKTAQVPGLKSLLLDYVMKHGEKDEKGSFFVELPQPIDIDVNGQRYKQVKAERRQGDPYLDVDKAREYLTKRKLLDQVEEFRYVLRLTPELATEFGEWLKESGLIEKVESTDAVLVEDKLLALHHTKVTKRGKPTDERIISEKDLDSLYTTPEATFAFKPLT